MSKTSPLALRARIVYLSVALFAFAIAVQLFRVQLFEGEQWRAKAQHVSTAWRTVQPERGHIYSGDGRLLATSVPEYDVRMDMAAEALTPERFSTHIDSLAWHLAALFQDRTKEEYKRDLTDARARKERYHLVKRRASHAQVQALRHFPLFRDGRFKSGLVTEKRLVRARPFGRLAARTVGYVLRDSTTIGLEGGYDKYLKGRTGHRLERRLAGGTWMPLDDGEGTDPEPGIDIHTTIDINLQDVADAALEQQLRKHGAQYGSVVVMEVATGRIKAISNLTRTADSTYAETMNWAVGEAAEPGSTFKLPALMVALEEGLIGPDDTVDTKWGSITYCGKEKMVDSHPYKDRKVTVRRAFEASLNTGCSQAVMKAFQKDPKRFVEGLKRMRLHELTGVMIPGEAVPTLRSPGEKFWSCTSLPWMSIGYEVAVTPLQMLTFYNAVANNGRMMQPQLVTQVSRDGRTIEEFEPSVLQERICSDKTLKIVHELLQGVVDSGTARNLHDAELRIAGKTGTAQILRNGSYQQNGKSYQASFAGYFPADKPLYSCIVVVNGPTMSGYYANVVAGPIFREIADKVYSNRLELQSGRVLAEAKGPRAPVSMSGRATDLRAAMAGLGVPFSQDGEGEWLTTESGDSMVTARPRTIASDASGLVPNVLGMGLRDALFLLENRGYRVRVQGAGMVKRQSIAPGTRAMRGASILIELA
ncbi:MAG: transpeptidase family protein [Flavobacteriales bacterium]|nr:transpeptidase family protein [Flavobacteriales bacterium]